MNENEFWRIVEKTSNQGTETQVNLLVMQLSQLGENEILDFDRIFVKYMNKAYDWNLWGAAYVIGGGCADDCFYDFRAWLILQGKKIYEKTLANPDSLADYMVAGQDTENPEMNIIAWKAYKIKTGRDDMPDRDWAREPKGQMFKEEDLPAKYPKLEAKFKAFWEGFDDD